DAAAWPPSDESPEFPTSSSATWFFGGTAHPASSRADTSRQATTPAGRRAGRVTPTTYRKLRSELSRTRQDSPHPHDVLAPGRPSRSGGGQVSRRVTGRGRSSLRDPRDVARLARLVACRKFHAPDLAQPHRHG